MYTIYIDGADDKLAIKKRRLVRPIWIAWYSLLEGWRYSSCVVADWKMNLKLYGCWWVLNCVVAGRRMKVLKLFGCWLKDESQAVWLLYEGSPQTLLLLVEWGKFSCWMVTGQRNKVLKLCCCWLKDESQALWLLVVLKLCGCLFLVDGSQAMRLLVRGWRISN